MIAIAVFLAGLVNTLIGAANENAYHAGDVRATGLLSFVQTITQGVVAWLVVADRSAPNLIASALAWSIGSMVGCWWKHRSVGRP